MRQTLAIFLDAYRELNARKLFWITLILSGVVVLAFSAVGINEKGLTLLWFEFPSALNTTLFPAESFYKWAFVAFGIKFWLTWAASILALVSTAGIFPEFVSSGSIELLLSKPIGRLRLFLTKYLAGLLFVVLQVSVFTLACFLVIGLRGKSWEPGLFWAVPITVLFFSYLFSICALIGLLTRSTIAALLLTLLCWFGIFGIHATEMTMLTFRERAQLRVEALEARIARLEARLAERAPASSDQNGDQADPPAPDRDAERLAADRQKLTEERSTLASLRKWHAGIFAAKSILPKTAETTQLLEHTLLSVTDMERLRGRDNTPDPMPSGDIRISGAELTKRIDKIQRSRTVPWVIGTSLAFQAVVLAIGAWFFCRRDF